MNMADTCRVCLCGDRRMYAISNTVLQEMWEKLTNAKFNTNDGKPCLVCYICCAQLRKCSQLRMRAMKAEELLTAFFNNGLEQTQEALSAMTSETDLDYSYVTKQLYQGECKEFEKDVIVEIKKEKESESKEDNAVEIEIDIKEEKDDYSDPLQEDKLDLADIKPSVLSAHNELVKKEAQMILENIDTETPSRKRMSNEVPQKAKRIKLVETTKDKNGLANAVLKSLPNSKCKASVRSSSKKTVVYKNVQNSKSKPDTKPIPNCTLVDKIAPKINTVPKVNDQTENIIVQNNKTLSSNLCYNDAEIEIFKLSLPKSADAVAHAKKKNFSCRISQHKCVVKDNLNTHLGIHTGEKPYMCDLCGYRCVQKNALIIHIKYKHTKEKNFSCHICQYKCVEKGTLNRHLLKHTSEKPHVCDFCDYRCSRKSYLKRHVTYKHTKEKNFSCHICQYKCSEKKYLNRHLFKHTGEKPYICNLCDYGCVQKNMLISHIKYKHTKEKNFSCHICQYKCVEKSNLNKHLLKHTGEKPYICDLCGYRCVQKNMLVSHTKHKHTKEKT